MVGLCEHRVRLGAVPALPAGQHQDGALGRHKQHKHDKHIVVWPGGRGAALLRVHASAPRPLPRHHRLHCPSWQHLLPVLVLAHGCVLAPGHVPLPVPVPGPSAHASAGVAWCGEPCPSPPCSFPPSGSFPTRPQSPARYDDTPHGMSPASNYGMSPARNMDYYTDYRNNGTTDAIVEEIEKDLLLMVDYLPIIVICLITLINLAGVDWLMRFESFLGLMVRASARVPSTDCATLPAAARAPVHPCTPRTCAPRVPAHPAHLHTCGSRPRAGCTSGLSG